MKYVWVVGLVVCLTVSGVWAQNLGVSSARSFGMGGAVIGVADDGAAFYQNPAGLAALNVPVADGKVWGVDAMAIYADADRSHGSQSSWGLLGSGWNPAKRMGFGVGFGDIEDDATIYGAGFGMGIGDTDWSVGLNVIHYELDNVMLPAQSGYGDDSETLLNLGVLYQLQRAEASPIRLGLLIEDLTDDTDNGPWFSVGGAFQATPELLLAADLRDLTDESDNGPFLSVGGEYKPAKLANWAFRAGLFDSGDDHDITIGAGYTWERWRLDVAYGDMADGVWGLTAATSF